MLDNVSIQDTSGQALEHHPYSEFSDKTHRQAPLAIANGYDSLVHVCTCINCSTRVRTRSGASAGMQMMFMGYTFAHTCVVVDANGRRNTHAHLVN